MQSVKYLNSILTIITVLLALHLWTWWSSQSPVPQTFDMATPAYAAIPNAGEQRQRIIDELQRLSGKVDALISMFRSGQARVRTIDSQNKK